MSLRIGIWFDPRHISYGGPAMVLIGTILGFIQDASTTQRPIILLINESGDVNWNIDAYMIDDHNQSKPNMVCGPMCFSIDDAETKDLSTHTLWVNNKHSVIPSHWYKWCISRGLPFMDEEQAKGRTCTVWGAGVDIHRFAPSQTPKTQDYFVYFKSQNYQDLQTLHKYLFNNYFQYTGSVLIYYHYDPNMLVAQAQKSRFCIVIDKTETQGLASLEIMACDCPLFVLDYTVFECKTFQVHGASSVPCFDERCGMKSSMETLNKDFPRFLNNLPKYKPREFVLEQYSYEASAHALRDILVSREHH